jgi:hypothetical protein
MPEVVHNRNSICYRDVNAPSAIAKFGESALSPTADVTWGFACV